MYRQHCTSYTDKTLKIKEEIVVYLCNHLMQHNIGPQHTAAQKGKLLTFFFFWSKKIATWALLMKNDTSLTETPM
jgi:hypothetical protein